MNQVLRKMTLLLLLCLFTFSQSSCATIYKLMDKMEYRADRGPYTPFTPIDFELEGIDQPEHAWTYHWPEDYDKTLEAMVSPQVDSHGNVYILGMNYYLYALNSSGERLWEKENCLTSLVPSVEGVLTETPRRLTLFDKNGKTKWSDSRYGDNFFLAPDGYMVGDSFRGILSYDAKGKLRWHLSLEDETYKSLIFETCFFDTQSNGYFLFTSPPRVPPEMEKNMQYVYHTLLFSVSSHGELRWKKVVAMERQFLENFIPSKESLVKDTFLLAFHQAEDEKPPEVWTMEWSNESFSRWFDARGRKPKIIKAFNADGEELWELEESRHGYHDLGYAIDQDNSFYFSFNERDISTRSWSLISGYLMMVSKEGKLLWSKAMEGWFETSPLLDKNKHIYIGLRTDDSNLFAFYPDGTEKWRMKVEVLNQYLHSLTFGPKRSLYFTSRMQSLLFCVRERE